MPRNAPKPAADADMPALRIAHLALTALPATVGGLEIVVNQLIRHQRRLGHDVSLITRWRQAGAAREEDLGYPVHALPPNHIGSRTPFRASGPRFPVELALTWHALRRRFDVIHAHWLYPTAWLAARAARACSVPLVATAHGADVQTEAETAYGYRQFPTNERRLHEVAPRLDAAIAISPNLAERLAEIGVAPARIHQIPNGVDFVRFSRAAALREATRLRLGAGSTTCLVFSVGRNQASKGFAIVPDVLSLLRRSGRDVIWCIVGAGVSGLQAKFEAAGVAEHVRLVEAIRSPPGSLAFPPDELIAFYGAADLFAFPSLTEGSPLVTLEAMAAGLPVVGNDVQGIRDSVSHEVDGLLTVPGDPASMASQIARLIDDAGLGRTLAAAGRDKARSRDWASIAARHCELYRSLLAGRTG